MDNGFLALIGITFFSRTTTGPLMITGKEGVRGRRALQILRQHQESRWTLFLHPWARDRVSFQHPKAEYSKAEYLWCLRQGYVLSWADLRCGFVRALVFLSPGLSVFCNLDQSTSVGGVVQEKWQNTATARIPDPDLHGPGAVPSHHVATRTAGEVPAILLACSKLSPPCQQSSLLSGDSACSCQG